MDWRLKRTVEATYSDVVTIQDMKDQLRIDHNTEDDLIERYIKAAIQELEGPYGIGIMLEEQEWEMYLDYFPSVIRVPLYPVQSIDSITYVDESGTEQTVDSEDYRVDTVSNPARIVPEYNKSWPATRGGELNAVTIAFTGGFTDVPEDLKHAVILLATHKYTVRQPAIVGLNIMEAPMAVESILSRYRVPGFG